jgi:hypothetical protein
MAGPKRPTIGLGYAMELILAAGICFGFVRHQFTWWVSPNTPGVHGSDWVHLYGGALMTGLALTGGVGLAAEAIRGRRATSWGLGRWIWSIAGLSSAFYVAVQFAVLAISRRDTLPGTSPFLVAVRPILERSVVHHFFGGFAWAIAAVCTTAMLARAPRDPEPDAREWAGRLFASLVVALNIAESLLRAVGR